MQESKTYQKVYDLLANELHIPMKYKGFVQLVEVISLKADNLHMSNTALYGDIAKKYKRTSTAITNNIAKIVNVANGTLKQEAKDEYFKEAIYTGGYITPSLFINNLAVYVHAKM